MELDHQSYPTLVFHTFPEGDSLWANFSSHILGLLRADADQGIQDLFTSIKVFFFYHLFVVVVCKWDYKESFADGFENVPQVKLCQVSEELFFGSWLRIFTFSLVSAAAVHMNCS